MFRRSLSARRRFTILARDNVIPALRFSGLSFNTPVVKRIAAVHLAMPYRESFRRAGFTAPLVARLVDPRLEKASPTARALFGRRPKAFLRFGMLADKHERDAAVGDTWRATANWRMKPVWMRHVVYAAGAFAVFGVLGQIYGKRRKA